MRSFAASLFISLLVTCASHAASPISIDLTRTLHTGMSPKKIRDADRGRFEFLMSGTNSSDGSTVVIPATDKYVEYTMKVAIGSPPTYFDLIVDTGSSNTFCGTGTPYRRTSTTIPTGQKVNVSYGTGYFNGLEYLDQVTLGPNLTITNQSIGDALNSSYFEGYDGIIGFGQLDLTNGTLSSNRTATIPTIMNNLFSQGLIANQILGVYFSPPVNPTLDAKDGVLTFGIDKSLYHGVFAYTPVTDTPPASYYWGINITSAEYTNYSIISHSTAGIVDTGTSLIYLADDFFTRYMDAIPGAKIDSDTGLIIFSNSSVHSMKPLDFKIGGRTFTLDATAQLLTAEQTRGWGKSGKRYGVVNALGHHSGRGLDFIIGKRFMERFYVVFDTDNHRVGFAFTNHTFSTTSAV